MTSLWILSVGLGQAHVRSGLCTGESSRGGSQKREGREWLAWNCVCVCVCVHMTLIDFITILIFGGCVLLSMMTAATAQQLHVL